VRDDVRGGIRGAKHFPALMQCRARSLDEPVAGASPRAEISTPDGESFPTSAPDAAARLGRFLGAPVSLWPLLPATALDHYRRGATVGGDAVAELRRVLAREPGEPLPDLSALPELLRTYASPPGTYFDAFPLLLMTTRGLASLAARAPGSRVDVRRFRPNLLIESEDESDFPERAWCGRRLRIGSAVLDVKTDCPRCVMTTLPFDDLPADPAIMRALVRETRGNLGVYATTVEPGIVHRGDRVELVA
jgi:hypothetical protein